MAKLPGVFELMATAASPAINFGRGLLGYQDPFLTQTMQDRMAELEAEKGPTGNIGYEDYGLQTATPGGRFTGGLMDLALNNPVDFGLAGSIGRYSYGPEGRTGLTYDFTPDQDTGSTGSATLDFINRGGLKGALSRMGTAQAAEVTPTRSLGDVVMEARANEPMDIEDFLGTSTPQDLGFIGNAPTIKEAVAPIGITDRGRGMAGPAVEMIGGQAVPVGDVLGRQMALEKADFYEEPKSRLDAGSLLSLAGLLSGSNVVKGLGMIANRDKIGRMAGNVRSGLGSLGTKVAGKMRGINPITGRPNTQAQYEQAREERRQQNRTDRMIDRITSGKRTRSNPREAGTTKAQKDAISAAMRESRRGGQYTGGGGGSSGGGGKIVCTMMNESYGFGNFRNKIWLKHSRDLPKEYEIGYHTIFLPLVKFAKGEGKLNKSVKKILEHVARHRTYDLKQEMKGKTHLLGRAYRKVLEPLCFIAGKIKSALGRG